MNQQPFNNPPQGQTPPPANAPFEAQPQPQQQAPMPPAGSPPGGYQQGGYQPTGMEPASGGKSWVLIIILVIVLILGALVFASWQGWISLGAVDKLWKSNQAVTTTTTTDTTATTESTANANDVIRKQDLVSLKDALKKYFQANQAYPVSETAQKTSDVPNVLTALVPTYIAELPVDPLSPTNYYGYKSDGLTFEITAALEDKTDPAGIQVGSYYLYKVTDTSTETPTTTKSESTTGTTTTGSTVDTEVTPK